MFQLKIDGKKVEIAFLSDPNLKIVGAIESLGLRQQSQMIWSVEGIEDLILDKLKNFCVRFSSVGAEIIEVDAVVEVDAVEVVDTQVDTSQPELLSGKNEIEDLRREVADLKKLLGVCSRKLSDLKATATPKTKKSRKSKASLRNGG